MNQPTVEDDGLPMWEINPHTHEKLSSLREELGLFSNMKSRFPQLVYLDLFASSGFLKDKRTGMVIKGSAMIGLEYFPAFSHFIFCEKNPKYFAALQRRVHRLHPALVEQNRVTLIQGDANNFVAEIKAALPPYSQEQKRLCLCVMDPFRLRELKYNTIKHISDNTIVDFMLNVMTSDVTRHWKWFIAPTSTVFDDLFGDSEWRQDLMSRPSTESNLQFVWRMFCTRMEKLRYRPAQDAQLVRNATNNSPLYRMVVFSREPLGRKFGTIAQRRGTGQTVLDL